MVHLEFYRTLFRAGEGLCWVSDVKGTAVIAWDGNYIPADNFFCINPLMPRQDMQPSKTWHSPLIGRRADVNVICYRNILCEFDKGSIEDQLAYIERVGLPYTTLVYSGGKSIHAIISLQDPCKSISDYKHLVKRIYYKMAGFVDDANSNPSRLSRAPLASRNGKLQALMNLKAPVANAALDAWLGPDTIVRNNPSDVVYSDAFKRILSPWTKDYLIWGAPEGARNKSLFNAACDMFRASYTRDEILNMVGTVADLPEPEIVQCVDSAENAVRTQVHGDSNAGD